MSVTVLYPPTEVTWVSKRRIFLAGSIEMGEAEDWQKTCISWIQLKHRFSDICLLNPRREDWDSSWEQSLNSPEFLTQVYWELNGIELSDHVLMYFDPSTKSPITLMELGICAASGKPTTVCCPDGFWRKGNVDIICQKYGIPLFTNLEVMLSYCAATGKFTN